MFDSLIYSVDIQKQFVYYAFVLMSFLYLFYKYRNNNLFVLLLLMFYTGLFVFLSSTINNLSKIIILAFTLWSLYQRKAWHLRSIVNQLWTIAFVLFSVFFFLSVSQSAGNTITVIFSQYARYLENYCLFFLLQDAIYRQNEGRLLLSHFYQLFVVQVFLAVIKFLLFPSYGFEALVGTLSYIGGAMGTTIPIIGFIILWFYRNGRMKWKDWLFVVGLFLVGFTTGKRAVWFVLPVVIAAFMVYVQGIRLNKYILSGIVAIPIVFYFGARLTPSLNPENKVWGSFDLEYMFDYAETYQFGEEGLSMPNNQNFLLSSVGGRLVENDTRTAAGRGNATIELFKLIFSGKANQQDWIGLGFSAMYSTDYGEFLELPLTIKLAYKGAATGMFQSYVTTGILGVITTIIFGFFPFFFIRHKRLRWVLLGIAAWEYFMYTGIIFRTPAFMAVFQFVLFYSNQQIEMVRWRKKERKRLQQMKDTSYETIDYSARI